MAQKEVMARITVQVLPAEKQAIEETAAANGRSASAELRLAWLKQNGK